MKLFKKTALAGALGLALLSTSCLGPDNTFNNLHKWNDELSESKWTNEAAFIGLTIIPVYSLAYLADILIFNSIEFWGGESPVESND
ncbi:MAG: hypothetical protein ACI8QZ_002500 [Chlamydiales bacterium]|jgi:hypothetical protein